MMICAYQGFYRTLHFNSAMGIKSKIESFRMWWHHMSELKKKPVAVPEPLHEHHICNHCGYSFNGRCCPQCGMPAGDVRFTFKRLIHNFLDIWGMGNRPMFRTMRDLMWRPGYMIRDYLGGHHLSYFPPFKMLAVLTIFVLFLAWIFNLEDPLVSKIIANDLRQFQGLTKNSKVTIDYLGNLLIYLDKYDLYRIIIQNIIVVPAAWLVFRKKGYNLVETFFSQIYINCQIHLISLLWMLIAMELPPTVLLPYYTPITLAFFILIYDYKQLYGLTVWQSIWRTSLFIALIFALYILIFIVSIAVTEIYELIPTQV